MDRLPKGRLLAGPARAICQSLTDQLGLLEPPARDEEAKTSGRAANEPLQVHVERGLRARFHATIADPVFVRCAFSVLRNWIISRRPPPLPLLSSCTDLYASRMGMAYPRAPCHSTYP